MEEAIQRINHCIKTKSIKLDISSLNLVSLPKIPSFIQTLDCSHNQLKELPASLPVSLVTLFCHNNETFDCESTHKSSINKNNLQISQIILQFLHP